MTREEASMLFNINAMRDMKVFNERLFIQDYPHLYKVIIDTIVEATEKEKKKNVELS